MCVCVYLWVTMDATKGCIAQGLQAVASYTCREPNSGPLQEKQILFTAKPPLEPSFVSACVLCVYVFTCVQACGGQRSMLGPFYCPPSVFFETRSLTESRTYQLARLAGQRASELQRSSRVPSPELGLQVCTAAAAPPRP